MSISSLIFLIVLKMFLIICVNLKKKIQLLKQIFENISDFQQQQKKLPYIVAYATDLNTSRYSKNAQNFRGIPILSICKNCLQFVDLSTAY